MELSSIYENSSVPLTKFSSFPYFHRYIVGGDITHHLKEYRISGSEICDCNLEHSFKYKFKKSVLIFTFSVAVKHLSKFVSTSFLK